MTKALVLTAVLVLGAGGVAEGAPAHQAPPRVAFFGFQLINTSLQSTTAEEEARIRMLDDAFRKKLDASGRFKIVPIPPDLREEVAAAPEISNCNGCERDFAIKAGADWAAWGTVQKVSNIHSKHQCLHRGRAAKEDGIRQKRRHPRQCRQVLATRPRLHASPLFVPRALTHWERDQSSASIKRGSRDRWP